MKIEGMLKKCGFAEQYLNISGKSQDAEKLLASSKKKNEVDGYYVQRGRLFPLREQTNYEIMHL